MKEFYYNMYSILPSFVILSSDYTGNFSLVCVAWYDLNICDGALAQGPELFAQDFFS